MGANRSTEQISVYSFVCPVALESKAENKETGRCNTKHTVIMISVISKNIGRNREKKYFNVVQTYCAVCGSTALSNRIRLMVSLTYNALQICEQIVNLVRVSFQVQRNNK